MLVCQPQCRFKLYDYAVLLPVKPGIETGKQLMAEVVKLRQSVRQVLRTTEGQIVPADASFARSACPCAVVVLPVRARYLITPASRY